MGANQSTKSKVQQKSGQNSAPDKSKNSEKYLTPGGQNSSVYQDNRSAKKSKIS